MPSEYVLQIEMPCPNCGVGTVALEVSVSGTAPILRGGGWTYEYRPDSCACYPTINGLIAMQAAIYKQWEEVFGHPDALMPSTKADLPLSQISPSKS